MFGVLYSKFLNMKPYTILLIAALAGGVISCKKNNAEHFDSASKESTKKLSEWFDGQSKLLSPGSVAVLGADQPEWSQAKYFDDAGLYITPLVLKEKAAASKFFVARPDGSSFKDGRYFVFLTSKGTAVNNPEQLITNHFSTAKTDYGNFSGAILQYDLENKLISTAHYKNGSKTSSTDNLLYKPKQERKTNGDEGPVGNVAPLECAEGGSQVCIDWFWQTWEEGVLVEEEYLYTTCQCVNAGGGSGNTNIEQLIANSILDPALNASTSNILQSCTYEFESQTTRTVIYYWQCINHPTYKIFSTERGNLVLSGNSSPSYKWKFSGSEGIQHLSTNLDGWSLGAEIKQETVWNDVVYSNERYFATITLEVKITASTTQKGILYEKYTTLHPSKNLYANNSQYVLPGY